MWVNFEQDSGFVQRLAQHDPAAWRRQERKIDRLTERKHPSIGTFYQEQIISRTLHRIDKYLDNYLFMARFSTWVYRIWLNEYLRLKDKIKAEQNIEALDGPPANGLPLGEFLPGRQISPYQYAERQAFRTAFYNRLTTIAEPLDVALLKGRMAGMSLKELHHALPDEQKRSIASISQRLKRLRARIAADGEMGVLAGRVVPLYPSGRGWERDGVILRDKLYSYSKYSVLIRAVYAGVSRKGCTAISSILSALAFGIAWSPNDLRPLADEPKVILSRLKRLRFYGVNGSSLKPLTLTC